MSATTDLLKKYGSPWELGEANDEWNDAQRADLAAYAAGHGGHCVLGNTNLDNERPIMWDYYPGDNVHNFGAAFAIPTYDQILRDLIVTRDQTPYTGVAQDSVLIDGILDRIAELGGITLLWT